MPADAVPFDSVKAAAPAAAPPEGGATKGTRAAPARTPPATAGTAQAMFMAPRQELGIVDGMDMREVTSRHRLRFTTPVRQPLVLISQIQRSGGTLLSQLLDGHSQLHVHPGELHIGRPNKYSWPQIDPDADAQALFAQIRELTAIRDARLGYQKLSGAELTQNPDHGELALPFIFLGQLQEQLFARALDPAPRSRRQVLDAYATSFFNAWLDYGGIYRAPETVRWWVGFVARLLASPGQVEQVFEDYPDGRLIIPLRDPESWLASARRHSEEYADTGAALALWEACHKRALEMAGARSGQVRLVRFERLVGETEACMREVAGFLDIRFEPSMLSPTFNGIPVPSNSSFGAGVGVDPKSANRADKLDEASRKAVTARTAGLYRKLGAIADYQQQRA